MEVAPGIHRIESRFAGRYLFQHVLVGDRVLLVDSGVPDTPGDVIFPYLESIGRDPADVDYLLVTHPDADHLGGNANVVGRAPSCRIVAHELDVRWTEDLDAMVAERYDGFRAEHGVGDPAEALAESRGLCGDPVPVDLALAGGEWLTLEEGWRVQILHTPGHSEGHLSVWDPRSSTLIIADAAMGRALPFVDGSPALAATYTHPGPYARTGELLRAIPAERLFTAHFPALEGEAIREHLDASIALVGDVEDAILDEVSAAAGPVGLRELIDAVDRRLGPLPEATRDTWAPPIGGHLDELVASGRLTMTSGGERTMYTPAEGARDAA
jgi:glyoxylase-like metal-dependent hydrolase (beta-lactamase superfamily II)